jgi:hypothetical protein
MSYSIKDFEVQVTAVGPFKEKMKFRVEHLPTEKFAEFIGPRYSATSAKAFVAFKEKYGIEIDMTGDEDE